MMKRPKKVEGREDPMHRVLSVVVLIASLAWAPAGWALEVGETAPAFSMQGSDGRTYSLADYHGKSAVVLAWYPKAFTSGCTLECKSMTEDGQLIRAFDVPYFMASVDPPSENARFATSMKADFPILSDPTKQIARAYGVLHEDRYALRTTFYIGPDGKVLRIDRKVDPANAARDIAKALAELGFEPNSGGKATDAKDQPGPTP